MKMSECSHSHGAATSSVYQSLDELDFDRGIWSAALKGDTDRVEKLLRKQNDVDQLDGAGYTALHYASRAGNLAMVRTLLAHGANVNATTKAGAATALHRAAAVGNLAVAELLLQKGATVGLLDADGQTPLHRAALGGHERVLEMLMTGHGDLATIKDVRGRDVMSCAQGHPGTKELLDRLCLSENVA